MEQWHYVRLGLARIESIYQPGPGPWSDEALFDVRAFFLHCYHLEDYLRTFDDLQARAYTRDDSSLRLCRDLVINIKHAQMSDPSWSTDGDSAVIRDRVTIVVSRDGHDAAHLQFTVTSGEQQQDVLDLARSCVVAWEKFGLPPSSHQTARQILPTEPYGKSAIAIRGLTSTT